MSISKHNGEDQTGPAVSWKLGSFCQSTRSQARADRGLCVPEAGRAFVGVLQPSDWVAVRTKETFVMHGPEEQKLHPGPIRAHCYPSRKGQDELASCYRLYATVEIHGANES